MNVCNLFNFILFDLAILQNYWMDLHTVFSKNTRIFLRRFTAPKSVVLVLILTLKYCLFRMLALLFTFKLRLVLKA